MTTRKLEELNLLDDFLFGTMVTNPEVCEKFVRELLRTIFNREFGKLTIIPQKVYYGSNTDKHGARLDVYVEEETEKDTDIAYDVEPDQNDGIEEIKVLPRRRDDLSVYERKERRSFRKTSSAPALYGRQPGRKCCKRKP